MPNRDKYLDFVRLLEKEYNLIFQTLVPTLGAGTRVAFSLGGRKTSLTRTRPRRQR